MKSWWQSRAPREQRLLLLAGGMLIVVLAIQFLLLPMLRAKDSASDSLNESRSTLVRLERLRDSGAAYMRSQPPTPAPDAAVQAASLAAETGLVLKPAAGSPPLLQFAFEPAEPTLVFTWVDEVESRLGLTVQSATFTSSGPGLVDATLVLADARQP